MILTVKDKFGDAGNCGGPRRYKEQRQYHLWGDAAMKAQEYRPFRMMVEVARSDL